MPQLEENRGAFDAGDDPGLCQRMLFTFSGKDDDGVRLVEARAEQLGVQIGTNKQVWIGPEQRVGELLERLGFLTHDVVGITGGLRARRLIHFEKAVLPSTLLEEGFQRTR